MSSASALAFCSAGAPCHVRGVGAVGAWGTSWTPTAKSAASAVSGRSGARSRTAGVAAATLVPSGTDCLNEEGCRGRRISQSSSSSSYSPVSMSSKGFPGSWRSRSHRRKAKSQQQQQQLEEQQPQQGRRQWKPLSAMRGLLVRRRQQRAALSAAAAAVQEAGVREQATPAARASAAELELPKNSGVLLLPPLSVVAASVAKETEQAFAAAGRAVVDASRPAVPFVQSLVRWEAFLSGLILVAAPLLLRSWARAESEHHDTLECRNVVQTYLIAAAGCVCAVLAAVAGHPVCAVVLQILWRGAAARSLWTWSDLGRNLTKTPGWLHASVSRWRTTATWVAVAGVAARILMLLVAATGIWTGVAGGLSAPTLELLPAWLVRAASRPDEGFGLSAAQLGLGVGIYAWVAYYLCFFLPYRALYDEYQSYDRRTAQIVKDMSNDQEYNVVLSTKLGPEFPKHLIRRMARMPPGDDRDTLGLVGIVRQRAGSHTVAKASQNVKNKEGKWGVKMMPVKFGDMRFWGSSLFERLEKQERRDEKTGWKKPDAPGSGDYRDNRLSYAKNMREIKVELGKTDAEMQNDPELSMLNLRNFDPDAEGGDFDLVLQDEVTNQGGIDAAGKNVRKNNPHEMVVTTDSTPAERERDAGVFPDDGDQTVRSTDDVSYNSGDTAGKALEDSIKSRSSPPEEKEIADKMTPATATRGSQDKKLKLQQEETDEADQGSISAGAGQAPRMDSRRGMTATADSAPSDKAIEEKYGRNDDVSAKSSDVDEMKAPKASTGFPWDALADSIRSVTRDIEKEELNEESKRGKTVDETEHASSPAVSKPESDSGGKESSSVDESQGQSGRSADEMPPSSGDAAAKNEEKETSADDNADGDESATTGSDGQRRGEEKQQGRTSEKPIDASSSKASKPVSGSDTEAAPSVDRSDPEETEQSTEETSSKSDDVAGKSSDSSVGSSASLKESAGDEATLATEIADALDEEQDQQESVSEKPIDVVTNVSPPKAPVVSKPGAGAGRKEESGADSSQEKGVGGTDEFGSDSDTPWKSHEESTKPSASSKEDIAEVKPAAAKSDAKREEEEQQQSPAKKDQKVDSVADDAPVVSKPGSGSGWGKSSDVDRGQKKDVATGDDSGPESSDNSAEIPKESTTPSASSDDNAAGESPPSAATLDSPDEKPGQEPKSTTEKSVGVSAGDPLPKAPVVSKPGSGSGWGKDGVAGSSEKEDVANTDATGSDSTDTAKKAAEDSTQSSAPSKESASEKVSSGTATPGADDKEKEQPQASSSEKPADSGTDSSLPKVPVVSKPGSGSGWGKGLAVDSAGEENVARAGKTEPESSDTSREAVNDSAQSSPSSKEDAAEKVPPATTAPASKDGDDERPKASTSENSVDPGKDDTLPKKPVVSKPGSGSGWGKGPVVDSSEEKVVAGTDGTESDSNDISEQAAKDSVRSSPSSKEVAAEKETPVPATPASKDEKEEQAQASTSEKSVETVTDDPLPKAPVVSKPGSGSGWDEGSVVDRSAEKNTASTGETDSESGDTSAKSPEDSAPSRASPMETTADEVTPATAAGDTKDEEQGQQTSTDETPAETVAVDSLLKTPVVSKPGSGSGWATPTDASGSKQKGDETIEEPVPKREDPAMQIQEESIQSSSSSSSPAEVAEPVASATATHDTKEEEEDEGQQERESTSEEPTENHDEDTWSAGSGSGGVVKEELGVRERDEVASKRTQEGDSMKFPWDALADSIRGAKLSLEGDFSDTTGQEGIGDTAAETTPADGHSDAQATVDSPPGDRRRDGVGASLDDDSSTVLSDAVGGSDSAAAGEFSISEDLGVDDEGDDWLLVLSPNGPGVILEEDFSEEEEEQEGVGGADDTSHKSGVPSSKPMEDLIRSRSSMRSASDTMSTSVPELDGAILSHMQSFSLAHMLFQDWLLPIKGVTEEGP